MTTSEALNAVEAELDTIEESLDTILGTSTSLADNRVVVAGSVAVLSLIVGVAGGYYIAKKRYSKIADREIAEVKDRYTVPRIIGEEKPSLEVLAERAAEAQARETVDEIIDANGYTAYNQVEQNPNATPPSETTIMTDPRPPVEQVVEVVTRNIFESDDPDTYFNLDEEMQRREEKPNEPYVITREEFDLDERSFEHITLTYYDGDEVLADEKDGVVPDEESIVGTSNLLRFGAASQDRNVVFVRNERLSIDFEVLRSDGKYAQEVLGFIEHSEQRGGRRFRLHD